jgi:hypothetical protein
MDLGLDPEPLAKYVQDLLDGTEAP